MRQAVSNISTSPQSSSSSEVPAPTTTTSTSAVSTPSDVSSSSSARPKYVVAHHMVGNTFPYTLQDWADDISLAHSSGIDGFALNMGSDEWQPDRVADAYQAALQSGLAFKMFLSLDMSSLPCASTSDAQSLRSLVLRFSSHPNQLPYSKPGSTTTSDSSGPLPLVSTFSGETCTFGQDTPANAWRSQFTQHDELKGKITFVPSFFIDPGTFGEFEGVMDGDFHWNGGWPVELTTASAGSSSSSLSADLTNLLGLGTNGDVQQVSSQVIPHLAAFLGDASGSDSAAAVTTTTTNNNNNDNNDNNNNQQNDTAVAESIASALAKFIGSTDGDLKHVQGLNGINAPPPASKRDLRKKRDGEADGGKIYMAAVSPWFFTHFGKDTFNKNFFYVADQHLYAKRWESLISASADAQSQQQQQALRASNNADGSNVNDTDTSGTSNATTDSATGGNIFNDVDIVEIISWNDYGESHYVGPIKGAQPTGSEAWTNGMGHEAWLPLTAYYAAAFKTGSFPNVTKDSGAEFGEKMFMWARPHPAQAEASQDGVGKVLGSELAEDSVWAITLLAEPANTTTPSKSMSLRLKRSVSAGLSKLSVPISVPDSVSQQQGGRGVGVSLDAGKEGFVFVSNPEQFNFNAWVGCAGCASASGNGTTTTAR
ncbi:hypothetical protein K435DRAFT_745710 [Dendrothele bispora CBS 962.96]|uniref:Glycoside hydrolase n=1 Tax=Dendrothele bispora (strain CBS 962.96) TaxID=1314807 RepID=A0A4S8MSK2_DENBC|nr:hypothetical protein K435DRAFT_745710 [Dendrothele bispora CBS 962.96]